MPEFGNAQGKQPLVIVALRKFRLDAHARVCGGRGSATTSSTRTRLVNFQRLTTHPAAQHRAALEFRTDDRSGEPVAGRLTLLCHGRANLAHWRSIVQCRKPKSVTAVRTPSSSRTSWSRMRSDYKIALANGETDLHCGAMNTAEPLLAYFQDRSGNRAVEHSGSFATAWKLLTPQQLALIGPYVPPIRPNPKRNTDERTPVFGEHRETARTRARGTRRYRESRGEDSIPDIESAAATVQLVRQHESDEKTRQQGRVGNHRTRFSRRAGMG